MAQEFLGIAKIKVGGVTLTSKDGAKLTIGGVKREERTGHRFYGFASSFETAKISCELYLSQTTPLEDLRKITATTITFEGKNGLTYSIPDAVCTGEVEVTDGDGTASLEFFGDEAVRAD